MRFNRPTSDLENQEYLQIPDDTDLQITTLSTGFSIFIRVQILSAANQNGQARTVYEKIDDSTPNNASMLQVTSDGRLVFIVKRGGTTYAKQTGSGLVPPQTVYDIFCVYAVSGNTIQIFVNGIEQSLNNYTGSVTWQTTLTNHDLFIFQRGAGSNAGFLYGDLFDFKFYKELVVSSTQVINHWNNKITISNIPYGQCMITNYWATFGGIVSVGLCSFSPTSFSPNSFNICSTMPPAPVSSFDPISFDPSSFDTS